MITPDSPAHNTAICPVCQRPANAGHQCGGVTQ
jgi:hypothetical protein